MCILALLFASIASCTAGKHNDGSAADGRTSIGDAVGGDALATDTGLHVDAPNVDAPVATDASGDGALDGIGQDGSLVGKDAHPGADTSVDGEDEEVAPDLCSAGPCPPECFRGVSCVRTCGGHVTWCGCCGCAAGSVDTFNCP